MFKLLRKLKLKDWLLIVVIIGVTVALVYCAMTMIDYMQSLIKSIGYVNAKTGIEDAFNAGGYTIAPGVVAHNWDELLAILSAQGGEAYEAMKTVKVSSTGDIWHNAGMMLLFAGGNMLGTALNSILASNVIASFAVKLRHDVNKRVSTFSLAEMNTFSTASLITRATNDIEQVQMTLLIAIRMAFSALVTTIWAICKIQSSSMELMTVTIAGVAVMVASLGAVFLVVFPKFKLFQKFIDKLNGISREHLSGIRVVHAFNAEGYQEAKFKKANDDMTKINLFASRMIALMSPIIILVLDGVSLALYWVGASLMNQGSTDYATVSSFMMLATQVIMSFMMVLFLFILWPRASVSAGRINEVLKTKSSIKDPENELEMKECGTIEFKNVSFAYPSSSGNVLSNLNFKVEQGQTLAIVGSTGCGKTSLIQLIGRFYDATEGEVLVGGVNVKDVKQETLRSKIGYVPQKGLLFSGTVRSNLMLGAPDLSEEDMKEAARIACADSFVEAMELGYDAPIAQGGTNVSGGQRQRLCIARAVAIKPEIFVFDDSFSALDFKTDLAVRENLRKSQSHATKVIVAQRIGTIMNADLILVLDEGKVVGAGKHKELLKDCSLYREIALSQLSKEELGL